MKGSRLVDVLDETPLDKTKWDMIFGKLKKLGTAIEMYWGEKMDIDNVEYRWVQDRIEYYEKDERLLTKSEMQIANLYWKKYNLK
tara:strand:- start:990 stop:1244 length:255 start_codon:yes stop_codon:yes gene_type:complete